MWDAWPARYIDAGMPEKSKIVGDQRVAALPGTYSLVSGWCLVMFKTCKDKDAAWEFIKFAVDPALQKEVILRGGDCNPTHLDVLNDKELQAKYEILRAVADSFNKTKIYCLTTQYEMMRSKVSEYLGFVFDKSMTPKEALDAAAKEVRQAMVDAGELK
jgi:ABC-type glycerol-3-phosphate transport system substrate-binding protein